MGSMGFFCVCLATCLMMVAGLSRKANVNNGTAMFPIQCAHLQALPVFPHTSGKRLWIDHPNAAEWVKNARQLPQWIKDATLQIIQNGFYVIKNGITQEQADAAVAAFQKFCKENPQEAEKNRDKLGHYNRLYNLHTTYPEALATIIENTKAMQLMDFWFNARTSVGNSIFFTRGTQQNIHVDIPFFWTVPDAYYFGYWVAFEETDENNGPLAVLPRGHTCNVFDDRHKIPELLKLRGDVNNIKNEDGLAFNIYGKAAIDNCASKGIDKYELVKLNKGDAVVWHPLLPHGGSEIKDLKRSRFSLVTHVVPEMTPLMSTDYFFNPSKKPPTQPAWDYKVVKDSNPEVQDYRLVGVGPQFRTTFAGQY